MFALTSTPARLPLLRALGAVPLLGDLDRPSTLGRLGGLADAVLHLAPPPGQGARDPRTSALLQALARGGRVRRLVYASTSGVYGDCAGERLRRDAGRQPRHRARAGAASMPKRSCAGSARRSGVAVSVLRIPGIYATDRPGGDPRERLRRGTPVLAAADDVFTNHIHADDLARACVAALLRAAPQRVYHASDDSELQMGAYFDLVADLFGMPRPPRITRAEAATQLGAMQLSFMSESRRLANDRLKRELRLRLRYPTVADGLRAAAVSQAARDGRRAGTD